MEQVQEVILHHKGLPVRVQRVEQAFVDVARVLQVVAREVPQQRDFVLERQTSQGHAVIAFLDAAQARLVRRVLDHVARREDDELDARFVAQLARMGIELFVTGCEQRDHAKLGSLQPSFDVLADVAAFLLDVRAAHDVLDTELAADARLVAARQIRHHAPVVGERHGVHLQLGLHVVQAVRRIAAAAEGHDHIGRAVLGAIRLDELLEGAASLGRDLLPVPAIATHTGRVVLHKGIGFGQQALGAALELLGRACVQHHFHGAFAARLDDVRRGFAFLGHAGELAHTQVAQRHQSCAERRQLADLQRPKAAAQVELINQHLQDEALRGKGHEAPLLVGHDVQRARVRRQQQVIQLVEQERDRGGALHLAVGLLHGPA